MKKKQASSIYEGCLVKRSKVDLVKDRVVIKIGLSVLGFSQIIDVRQIEQSFASFFWQIFVPKM